MDQEEQYSTNPLIRNIAFGFFLKVHSLCTHTHTKGKKNSGVVKTNFPQMKIGDNILFLRVHSTHWAQIFQVAISFHSFTFTCLFQSHIINGML